jgi:hypothetical protein
VINVGVDEKEEERDRVTHKLLTVYEETAEPPQKCLAS